MRRLASTLVHSSLAPIRIEEDPIWIRYALSLGHCYPRSGRLKSRWGECRDCQELFRRRYKGLPQSLFGTLPLRSRSPSSSRPRSFDSMFQSCNHLADLFLASYNTRNITLAKLSSSSSCSAKKSSSDASSTTAPSKLSKYGESCVSIRRHLHIPLYWYALCIR
jgi:hypothetical protein